MEINYARISIEELDRVYFTHCEVFDFICDGDSKKIIIKKIKEEI